MMKILVLLGLFLMPNITHADENDSVCRVLKKQAQSTNAARYVPGVDSYGRPVIAAEGDLPALSANLPLQIKVPLTIELAENIPSLQAMGLSLDSDLGSLQVNGDGQVVRDDEDITDIVVEYCNLPAAGEVIESNIDNVASPQDIFMRNDDETIDELTDNDEEWVFDEIDDLLFGE